MTKVTAERVGERIVLSFPFDASIVNRVKGIRGRRYAPRQHAWTVPLNLETARALRATFGDQLQLGPNLRVWGKEQVTQETKLKGFALNDDAELVNLPNRLPKLAQALRPYQRADVRYMAATSAINGNEPRLGKTLEVIAAVFEAGLQEGPQLVIAPSEQSMETVWRYELNRWQHLPAFTLHGGTPARERYQLDDDIDASLMACGGFWLVTTPNMVRTGFATEYDWKTITIDEFQKMGLTDPKSALSRAIAQLSRERFWPLSGTPMGGKPLNLWGVLKLLSPKDFTSKWRWADEWLQVDEEEIYVKGGAKRKVKVVGNLKPDREPDFYPAHARFIVRRLKKEVMPALPENQVIEVMCKMGKEQAKQYNKFADAAELRIEELRLVGDSILAEYLWLKRFAFSVCELEEYEVKCPYCQRDEYDVNVLGECLWCEGSKVITKVRALPTSDSCKLEALLDRITEDDEPAVVASQFSTVVDVTADYLTEAGIECVRFTGKTKRKGERAEIISNFQSGVGPRVIVMTTTAGGVSIPLSRATSTHILDETWNPDDQTQLVERMFDQDHSEPKYVFYYRTFEAIDHYIAEGNALKSNINDICLDIHRKRLQELRK